MAASLRKTPQEYLRAFGLDRAAKLLRIGDAPSVINNVFCINPLHVLFNAVSAEITLEFGDAATAESHAHRAAQLDPALASGRFILALALQAQERTTDARAAARRALNLDSRAIRKACRRPSWQWSRRRSRCIGSGIQARAARALPIAGLPRETFAGRVGASLLNAVGLPELIADSTGDYVALAIALAGDHDRRALLRAKLLRARIHGLVVS